MILLNKLVFNKSIEGYRLTWTQEVKTRSIDVSLKLMKKIMQYSNKELRDNCIQYKESIELFLENNIFSTKEELQSNKRIRGYDDTKVVLKDISVEQDFINSFLAIIVLDRCIGDSYEVPSSCFVDDYNITLVVKDVNQYNNYGQTEFTHMVISEKFNSGVCIVIPIQVLEEYYNLGVNGRLTKFRDGCGQESKFDTYFGGYIRPMSTEKLNSLPVFSTYRLGEKELDMIRDLLRFKSGYFREAVSNSRKYNN